jgi:hypothetical protein
MFRVSDESAVEAAGTDPRDEPAPLGETVALTTVAAAGVMLFDAFAHLPEDVVPWKLLLFGPFGLVFFAVISHEVWWRRWWGVVPGALAGLAVYFEGGAALTDIVGESLAHPLVYVTAWSLFAAIFAVCSRLPRRAR